MVVSAFPSSWIWFTLFQHSFQRLGPASQTVKAATSWLSEITHFAGSCWKNLQSVYPRHVPDINLLHRLIHFLISFREALLSSNIKGSLAFRTNCNETSRRFTVLPRLSNLGSQQGSIYIYLSLPLWPTMLAWRCGVRHIGQSIIPTPSTPDSPRICMLSALSTFR